MKREREYQAQLRLRLRTRFPGCIILKNDSSYLQGVPDLIVLYQNHWAMLEVKASENSPEQPNQAYYIDELNKMSFASFIYPENEEEVLDAMEQSFKPRRSTRVSKRE